MKNENYSPFTIREKMDKLAITLIEGANDYNSNAVELEAVVAAVCSHAAKLDILPGIFKQINLDEDRYSLAQKIEELEKDYTEFEQYSRRQLDHALTIIYHNL